MQLITLPEKPLNMYYKRGRIGDDARTEERLEEWDNINNALKEFTKQFEELTGNEFEPWEREKKIQKKPRKFFPIDMVLSPASINIILLPFIHVWNIILFNSHRPME